MRKNSDLEGHLREVRDIADLGLDMSDGCRLSIRAWIPADAEARPVPAIVEHLPYRKRDGTTARDEISHPWMAARGYAVLRVDMRGNGDSHGLMEDEYTQQELDDAVEIINWAASQPWCTGNVGMQGISWGGFNGLQVAAMAPEPLKAIITLCSTVDRFADDIHYKGGCLLNENLAWSSTMWAYSSRPPDPALRDDWRDLWMTRLEHEPFLISTWLRHQKRDAYWEHGSICEDYRAIEAKVLALSGWADGYKNTVPALVDNIEGAKGILGPWVHLYPHIAVPEPRIGFLQEAKRWWDRWLKGEETGVEEDPAMRMYLMEGHAPSRINQPKEGIWIADAQTGGAMRSLALGAGGRLGGAATEISVPVASDATCGLGGSEYYAIGRGPELSGDQRVDDLHSAVWTGDTLESAVDIVGQPKLTLRLSADTQQGQIAVRLNHVHPDGQSTRITYGVLNLAHRDSHAAPEPMEPGRFYDVEVVLDQIAYRVPQGHRIAVAVSTAYWPLIWPAPERTALTITQGALDLPERAAATAEEWRFEPPDGAEGWQTEELRSPENIRRETHDLATGEVTLVIEDDFGKRRDLVHGLVSGGVSRERWTIRPDDPLSARAETHWTQETEREGLILRTETYAQMSSDAQDFHLSARIEAYENDILVYERDVADKIARDHQ
ncbi:CocE/NonD family hydrolase [Marivita sp.]|uniref:CocE/NonD family hydrolase n=1 Tax=Marivita sp. TaxID=2003365 RepID=UPI0025C5E773|nr:CocE/NonD family hydrolase [Marivita sp.]